MAGAINCRDVSRRFSSRPIPKRGQVKVAIVVNLANSVAAIFCHNRCRAAVVSVASSQFS